MRKWEDEVIGRSVNGLMSVELNTREKCFKFADRGTILLNDMKKVLYSVQIRGDLESYLHLSLVNFLIKDLGDVDKHNIILFFSFS
jgi:hypothetical protein